MGENIRTPNKYYELLKNKFNLPEFRDLCLRIYELEKRFSYRDFQKSARLCADNLKRAGAKDVKLIRIPSDGKSCFFDHIMPEAFDLYEASLEIIEPADVPLKFVADTKESYFCVANRSAPTPEQGIIAEVITEKTMNESRDISVKMVFTQKLARCVREEVVAKNGAGIISSFSAGQEKLRDAYYWNNDFMDGPGWYHTNEDKKIICFSITPRRGKYLEELLSKPAISCSGQPWLTSKRHKVRVRAKVKSRICSGKLHTVTGLIPGIEKKEILLLAHIYEPLLGDNPTGAVGLIEICRILTELLKSKVIPPLRRGIRFVISMERYGFAHYFSDPKNRENVLTASNVDSPSNDFKKTGLPLKIMRNPASMPFFGDFVLENLVKSCLPSFSYELVEETFSDDDWIADQSVGVPVNWLLAHPGIYHHNSLEPSTVNWYLARDIISVMGTYSYMLASGEEPVRDLLKNIIYKEAKNKIKYFYRALSRRQQDTALIKSKNHFFAEWIKNTVSTLNNFAPGSGIENEIERLLRKETKRLRFPDAGGTQRSPLSAEDRRAKKMIIKRKKATAIFSLARVPLHYRPKRTGTKGLIIPPYIDVVLNWADGKRNLRRIFNITEIDRNVTLDATTKSRIIEYCLFLKKYGYINVQYKNR